MTDSGSSGSAARWRVGKCTADLGRQLLLRDGVAVNVRPKVWVLLTALLQRPNGLVSNIDLMGALWPRQDIDPKQLVNLASELRSALGDPFTLISLHRRGYVLVATPATDETADLAAAEPQRQAGQCTHSHFVGRGCELQALRVVLSQALENQAQMVEVVGPAGVGKSTLMAQWLAEVAGQAQWTVLLGHAVDVAGDKEPFGPLIQMLESHALSAAADHVAEDLQRWAPCWLAQLPGLLTSPQAVQLQQEVYRSGEGRMRREGVALLSHWASRRPLLIVLEDIQWADTATLDLLALLSQTLPGLPLVVVTTRRLSTGVEPDVPAPHDLYRSVATSAASSVALQGFGAAEVRDYVHVRAPHLLMRDDQVLQLTRLTDGLPLFLKTVVDELLASGEPTAGERGVEQLLASVVQQLRQVVLKRAASLHVDLRALVDVACCMSEAVPVPVLALTVDSPEPAVEARCQRLVRLGLFSPHPSLVPWGGERVVKAYGLAHALYREALFGDLPAPLMMVLSRRMALALRAADPNGHPATPGLAAPYSQAGMHEEAAAALRMSGMRSLGRFSTRHAVQALQASLAQLQQLPDHEASLAQQLETCWDLSRVLMIELSPTDERVEAVRDLILSLAPKVKTDRSTFLLLATQCARAIFGGRADLAEEPAAQLRGCSSVLGHHEQALAQLWRGNAATAHGRLSESAAAFAACLALPLAGMGLAGLDARAIAATQLTWTLAMTGEMDAFAERAQALEAEVQATRSAYLRVMASFWMADALRQLGCVAAADRRYRDLLDLCVLYDSASFGAQARMGLQACVNPDRRDLTALLALSPSGSGRRPAWSDHMLSVVTLEAMVAQGHLADAQALLHRMELIDSHWPLYRSERLRLEGDLAYALGRPSHAQALWQSALAIDIEHRFLPGLLRHLKRRPWHAGAAGDPSSDGLQAALSPLMCAGLGHPDLQALRAARDELRLAMSG